MIQRMVKPTPAKLPWRITPLLKCVGSLEFHLLEERIRGRGSKTSSEFLSSKVRTLVFCFLLLWPCTLFFGFWIFLVPCSLYLVLLAAGSE